MTISHGVILFLSTHNCFFYLLHVKHYLLEFAVYSYNEPSVCDSASNICVSCLLLPSVIYTQINLLSCVYDALGMTTLILLSQM